MNKLSEIENKINKLRKELFKLENDYYSGNSTTEDEIYDFKLRTLINLENEFPQFKNENSPTVRIGRYIDKDIVKASHEIEMMSLNNAFNKEELFAFFKSCEKYEKDIEYFLEPKIDGASISLIYEKKYLKQAISRGDGKIGEDLTKKIQRIKSIPLYIENSINKFTVRGEIYIEKKDFQEFYEKSKGTKKTFANHRNFVSGSLRLKNLEEISKKKLKIKIYQILNAQEQFNIFQQSKAIEKIRELGFLTHDKNYILTSSNKEEIWKFIENFKNIKDTLNFPCDGLVIKVNDLSKIDDIGTTSKFPKWAIAYKYPSLIKESKLLKIIPTVGRTGKITYLGQLCPTIIDGSNIQYATLHNAKYIQELDLRIGDYVSVYKSGEIIPKIIGFYREKRPDNLPKWIPNTHCPSCNTLLVTKEKLTTQFCTNENCLKKKYARISHFVSRSGVNIEGLSDQIIIKLNKLGILEDISDIYRLKDHKSLILNSEIKIKDKLFNKLVNAIEKTKNSPLEKTLFALGIEYLGQEASQKIAKKFNSIEKIKNVSEEDIKNISGIGEKCAKSLTYWFSKEKNLTLIEKLKLHGLFSENINEYQVIDSILKDKKVVITGKLSISRQEFSNIISKKYGAIVSNIINSKTNFLICGEDPGNKKKQAELLGIKIIGEKELKKELKIQRFEI